MKQRKKKRYMTNISHRTFLSAYLITLNIRVGRIKASKQEKKTHLLFNNFIFQKKLKKTEKSNKQTTVFFVNVLLLKCNQIRGGNNTYRSS